MPSSPDIKDWENISKLNWAQSILTFVLKTYPVFYQAFLLLLV
jgi:hypothetical protein